MLIFIWFSKVWCYGSAFLPDADPGVVLPNPDPGLVLPNTDPGLVLPNPDPVLDQQNCKIIWRCFEFLYWIRILNAAP